MLQTAVKLSVAVICSIWWETHFSDLNHKFFDLNDIFFVNMFKNATKKIETLGLAECGSICWEEHFFVLNDNFFVTFIKNSSKQQKSLV